MLPIPEWFLGYFAVILLANLLVVWIVIRRTSLDPEADDESPGGGQVRCPECDTSNEARFRFCESCLHDLSEREGGPLGAFRDRGNAR